MAFGQHRPELPPVQVRAAEPVHEHDRCGAVGPLRTAEVEVVHLAAESTVWLVAFQRWIVDTSGCLLTSRVDCP